MADLTTVAAVKAWGGILGSIGDPEIASLITSTSAWIGTYCNRVFGGVASFSEIRHGTGGQALMLANGPVAAITSLTGGAVPILAQAGDGQAGYFLDGNMLVLEGRTFPRGRSNVRVTYTAGYAAVPADVAQACIEIVVSAYRRGGRGPDLKSQTIGPSSESHSWAQDAIPAAAKLILDRYQRVAPV